MRVLCFIGLLIFSAGACLASDRVALVIGNGAYKAQPKLPNPVADAVAVADKLKSAGFKVTLGTDLTFDAMRRTINTFAGTVLGSKAAVLFYAGHGVQVNGENYLVPIDANIERAIDLAWQTVAVSTLVGELEGAGRTNIIILDACRNNPGLTRRLRSLSSRTRSFQVSSGLAQVSAPDGSYVAFSTAPDTVALDGYGKHSPFAKALIKHLPTPGLGIESMMRRVRRDVRRATKRQQTPWDSSSLTQPFYFIPKVKQKPKQIHRVGPPQHELSYWDSVKNSGNPKVIGSYLKTFPKGYYANLARVMIQEMNKEPMSKAVQADEERKVRRAERERLKAKQEQEAVLKKANEARHHSQYEKALADAEAKLKQAKIQKERDEAARARARRKAELEKSEKEEERVAALSPPVTKPEEQVDKRKVVRQLQQALQRLGCYKGKIDGLWGSVSQRGLDRALPQYYAALGPVYKVLQRLKTSGVSCAKPARRKFVKPAMPKALTRKKSAKGAPAKKRNCLTYSQCMANCPRSNLCAIDCSGNGSRSPQNLC